MSALNQVRVNGVDYELGAGWVGSAISLSVGATTQTFTGLSATGAYDFYFECADGYAPPVIESVIQGNSGTSCTVTFSAVTSDQDGTGGQCKIRLLKVM